MPSLRAMFAAASAVAALLGQTGAAAASERTATGCPAGLPSSENERLRVFGDVHEGRWPPPLRYPGRQEVNESETWEQYMQIKERDIMAIPENSPWRWERWLEFAQIRMLKTFTEKGWGIGVLPNDLHAVLLSQFRAQHDMGKGLHEGKVAGYIEGERLIVDIGKLRSKVTRAVQKLVAEWAGYKPEELVPTSTYGVRVYYRNSTLETHVDRVETHILSAVYVVDYHYDSDTPGSEAEPWYIVTDPDHTGHRQQVHVKRGEVFFYESAKLPHGRPSRLDGDYSAHIFVHFKPKDWVFHNSDRVYALPSYWGAPARPAGSVEDRHGGEL